MDTLLAGTLNRRNVILTSLQGFERTRFLLKNELTLLAKVIKPDESVAGSLSFKKIVHVCDSDQKISRVYDETQHLPFEEFGLKVVQYISTEPNSDGPESNVDQESAHLVICNLKNIFNSIEENNFDNRVSTSNAVVIFDGITLENIEGLCCEVQEQKYAANKGATQRNYLPQVEFGRLGSDCWSIILACNPPVDGLEAELGVNFPIVLNDPLITKASYKIYSSIVTHGPTNVPLSFNTSVKDPNLHSEVGAVLEKCVNQVKSGPIVVFFPSYGRMIEYHNAWQSSGLFSRMSLPYGRENRGGDHFKNGLLNLARQDKSIFLFSIRYHKDEKLAEFVLSLAKAVLVVGLPYPFTSDTWDARIKYNNEMVSQSTGTTDGRLNGSQVYKYRAIEFMNGVLKRCLNEFRYQDCNFYLLDKDLKFERNKIAYELGDIQENAIDG